MTKKKPKTNDDLTGPVLVKQITTEEIMIELGVPATKKSNADLLNHVPKRFVPLKEAQERGISWWWDGSTACKYGHVAAHRTSNHKICSDCFRIRNKQAPIYGKSSAQKFYKIKDPATTPESNTAAAVAAPAPKSLGLSAEDTKFLAAYAKERDLNKAAKAHGTTKELILARRVGFPAFGEAMSQLERQLEIPKYMPAGAGFVWTDDARRLFIEHYINTGLVDEARQAVGCTRAQYFAEVKRNVGFASEIEAARPLAESIIEEAFTRAAKQGQQSILPRYAEILEARAKQYSELPRDPTTQRVALQKILDEIKSKIIAQHAWRVIATRAIIPLPQLEEVLRDKTTGVIYRPEELESIDLIRLTIIQNSAAPRAAAAIDPTGADVPDVMPEPEPEEREPGITYHVIPDDEPGNT